jgi:AcrR family transcriptional regulator
MSIINGSQDTAARLLAAATEVFTEMGYRNATLRAICQRAGANNAAINYHFRDKEHLYLAVIEQAITLMNEGSTPVRADPDATPEQRLRAFIYSLITDMLSDKPSWLMKLVARELAEPTVGLDLLLEKLVRPFNAELKDVVREVAGPGMSEDDVDDCATSIVAQCHHFEHAQAAVFRMGRYTNYTPEVIDHLADHITRFSLAGIRALAAHETH